MIFTPTFRTAGAVAAAAVLAAFMSAPAPALAAQLMAQAQTPPAAMPAPAAPSTEATPPAAPEAAPAAPAAQPAQHMSRVEHHNAPLTVERRISRLHGELHITAAEAPEWNAFAQAMREQAEDTMQAIQEQQNGGSMNAVEHLRAYEKLQEAQYNGVKKLVPAFEGLYDKMSPAQKRTADAIFNRGAKRRAPKTSG